MIDQHENDIADTRKITGDSRVEKIRQLNDFFRAKWELGKVYVTNGVMARGEEFFKLVAISVKHFTDFNEANDSWGEHDFGRVVVTDWDREHPDKVEIFWKIDYYDKDMLHQSRDPSNPELTTRVLTLMLAEEY